MNLSFLAPIASGLMAGYGAHGNPFANTSPGAAMPQMGGGVESAMLPGIMPGATVPLQTGVNAGGGMFGGVGQGLTNAGAGLFQPGSGAMVGGNAPSQRSQAQLAGLMGLGGGINPLALALMNRS